jgi:hypothetical protein
MVQNTDFMKCTAGKNAIWRTGRWRLLYGGAIFWKVIPNFAGLNISIFRVSDMEALGSSRDSVQTRIIRFV